jgi:hypothetical protein
MFEVVEDHLFDLMNSPQPLSASLRGAKPHPLLLPAREWGRGMSSCGSINYFACCDSLLKVL